MTPSYSSIGTEKKYLCCDCINEDFLSTEVARDGIVRKCSYCGSDGPSYTIGQLSERIETAFEQHYTRTDDQPDAHESMRIAIGERRFWVRDGDSVADAIQYAAEIPEDAARDIQRILECKYWDRGAVEIGEETEFDAGTHYERKGADDLEWQTAWHNFERSLKIEARFFSRSATLYLAGVFGGVDTMRTHDGRKLVVRAGPSTRYKAFYRARAFQSDPVLEEALKRPDRHVGTPPSSSAAAGRMNARGISVFYGASRPNVAIAEVRPPVGSRVVVARFEIIRPLQLLDLTALSDVTTDGSIFDPTSIGRFERARFLRSLTSRITRPVMPDDEPSEYLVTQAIADFLATENEPQLDGIIFPSVQAGGKARNVVLFRKASEVEEIGLPHGTEISAHLGMSTEDGWEDDYSVSEQTPHEHSAPPIPSPDRFTRFPNFGTDIGEYDPWPSNPTLRIDLDSVHVHTVRAVQVKATGKAVSRHRWTKPVGKADF